MRNTSSNEIAASTTMTPSDYDAVLTSPSGGVRHLIEPFRIGSVAPAGLSPGEQLSERIGLPWARGAVAASNALQSMKDLQPGEYVLSLSRFFGVGKIDSNPLKIHILAPKVEQKVDRVWGQSVQGLQLSVSSSKTEVRASEQFPIEVAMRNTSSNILYWEDWLQPAAVDGVLTASSGANWKIAQVPLAGRLIEGRLDPGEEESGNFGIPYAKVEASGGLTPMSTLAPGEYSFYLTCEVKGSNVVSNPLKIKISAATNQPDGK